MQRRFQMSVVGQASRAHLKEIVGFLKIKQQNDTFCWFYIYKLWKWCKMTYGYVLYDLLNCDTHKHGISLKLFIFTPPRNCLSVCLCVSYVYLWSKFQPNRWIELDAVFAKWLLTALAQTLLKLMTLGQRSRSQWRNTHLFFIILCWFSYFVSQLSFVWSKWNSVCPLVYLCLNFIKTNGWWHHLSFLQKLSITLILLNLQTLYLEPIHNIMYI